MIRCGLLLVVMGLLLNIGTTMLAGEIDYNRDIRPILSENCIGCHGPDAKHRHAELRVDQREVVIKAADSGAIPIVPGKPLESELVKRILSSDADTVMPPPDSHKKLTAKQKQLLQDWVTAGANYAEHWSLIPPVASSLPTVKRKDWSQQPLDQFILARLEQENLQPSPIADKHMLVRRLYLDLLGIPPTVEQVNAFVNDQRADAYEQLVDQLLASPHYGERMALAWLDAARYADTNGFSIDGGRNQWLWRDWVIQSFNSNQPYNQFLIEQLAGDHLPNAQPSQLIATGFQRNNMVTHEGGTIPEENLTNYNVDRVKTLGESILGLTLGCAQCHDHKYDPIKQQDFYQLFAYFNTVSDIGLDGNGGNNPRPQIKAKTVLQTGDELKELQTKIAKIKEHLATPDPQSVATWEKTELEKLQQRGKGLELTPCELLKVSTPNRGSGFEVEENRYVQLSAADFAAYDLSLKLPAQHKLVQGVRVVFYPDEKLNNGWGYGPNFQAKKPAKKGETTPPAKNDAKGNFVLTAFTASTDAVAGDQVNLHRVLPIAQVTASSWQEKYPATDCLDPRNFNGWSPDAASEGPVHLTVTFTEPIDVTATPFITIQLNFGHGRSLVAKRFDVHAMIGTDDGTNLPTPIVELLQKPQREASDQATLARYFSEHSTNTRPLRIDLANAIEREQILTQEFPTMVMDQSAKPRKTFILNRGDYSQPTTEVGVGTPAALIPLPKDAPANRLGLAQWLVQPNHPLTARVAVNRIWQQLFGIGIVATAADFGMQGEYPSHPELLDWLAVDFVKHGWDTKRLVKQIVMSQTYRQTSKTTTALLERDPQNRLLARGPRFRLPAELIRDNALAISGLFVKQVGGPSVNPYTPGDLWREISHYGSTPATAQTFVQDHGEKLYRRSLYTYWKRTAPPPNMVAFDAPNRETCVVTRPGTNTPLQALVLLNDVQYVEASRAFAERIIAAAVDDQARLRWAIQTALARPATEQELSILTKALAREQQRYTQAPELAQQYLAAGESSRNAQLPVAEHAAWSQVALLIMNLSETITRN
jgi:hypothetical protein